MANSFLKIFVTEPAKDYELIDSGNGTKLERFGKVVISRPDPQALWRPKEKASLWNAADAIFQKAEGGEGEDVKGKWALKNKNLPEKWNINYDEITLGIRLTPFKHTGLFPEQIVNWQWMTEKIRLAKRETPPTVLNLFGYTGGATLAATKAGAKVTHVDASKSSMTWASDNAKASGLSEDAIRWILEDAQAFVQREVKRGNTYAGIIMDPPSFGRGAKGEIWKIEKDFLILFENCLKLLSDKPIFFIVNGYAAGYSSIAYENNLKQLVAKFGGTIESGELAIRESGSGGRLLPAGIVSRWSA